MFCEKCGNQISDNSKFCGVCGKRVAANDTVNSWLMHSINFSEFKLNLRLTNVSFQIIILSLIAALSVALIPYSFLTEDYCSDAAWVGMFYGECKRHVISLTARTVFGVLLLILLFITAFSALAGEYKVSMWFSVSAAISNFVLGIICCWSPCYEKLYAGPFFGILITSFICLYMAVYLDAVIGVINDDKKSHIGNFLLNNFRKSKCTNCGATLVPGRNFCGKCGTATEHALNNNKPKCANCGAEIRAGAAFCANCGNKTNS